MRRVKFREQDDLFTVYERLRKRAQRNKMLTMLHPRKAYIRGMREALEEVASLRL